MLFDAAIGTSLVATKAHPLAAITFMRGARGGSLNGNELIKIVALQAAANAVANATLSAPIPNPKTKREFNMTFAPKVITEAMAVFLKLPKAKWTLAKIKTQVDGTRAQA